MKNIHQKRIDQLRYSLTDDHIDTLLVLVAENRHYLSGFGCEDGQFDESAGALFITPDQLILATDSRFTLQAEREAPLFEIIQYQQGLDQEIAGILKRLGTERLGFESLRLSFNQYQKIQKEIKKANFAVQMVATQDLVEHLRMIKDEDEIRATQRALSVAETVFQECILKIRPGMTEKELAWNLERGLREAGAESLSFPSIVAAGPNSALPHAVPSDRKIAVGEPILFDWGAVIDGYCSDTTRTLVYGKANKTFERVYGVVYDAQLKAIEAISPGVATKKVDAIAREYIDSTEFKGKFGHGLGHGTGLAVHEKPRLSTHSTEVLEVGMIVTVEPGIYLADWGGIRLENQVVVREQGAEILTGLDFSFLLPGEK